MKASKALLLAACLTLAIVSAGVALWGNHKIPLFCDIHLRHSELLCAHEGVNPFHVWSQKVTSERFVGHSRPDLPEQTADERLRVHAYPPWHTAFVWFFGWLSQSVCTALVVGVSVAILLGCLGFVWRSVPQGERLLAVAVTLALHAKQIATGLQMGNYGPLCLGLLVALWWALERQRHVLAGVCWALLMIKPQVAMLFFWPLLCQRQYKAIAVAVALCVVATLWPAFVYHESPLALILQIPEIGKPYIAQGGSSFTGIAYSLAGETGQLLWAGLCFIACGVFSFMMRKSPSWVLRFTPAFLIFPLWTYSQGHDLIVQAPFTWFVLTLAVAEKGSVEAKGAKAYLALALGVTLFTSLWEVSTRMGWFNPSGRGWIFRLVTFGFTGLTCAYALFHLRRLTDSEGTELGAQRADCK